MQLTLTQTLLSVLKIYKQNRVFAEAGRNLAVFRKKISGKIRFLL